MHQEGFRQGKELGRSRIWEDKVWYAGEEGNTRLVCTLLEVLTTLGLGL